MKPKIFSLMVGFSSVFFQLPQLSAQNAVPGETMEPHKPEFAERFARYRIGTSDVLDIEFPLVPEFNQVVTVQPDGFISLKSVGDLHAAGLSTPELKEAIRTAYKNTLNEPVFTITLKDYQKPYFTAIGKVIKPGKYELRGDTTVTEAIAMAGGFDDAAKHSQVLLFHHATKDRVEIKKLDIKHLLATGNTAEDVVVQPGDMIMVPKSALAKVKPWIPSASMGAYTNTF